MSNVIYGLIDPNTEEVRYVGKTINLTTRMINHHNRYRLKSPNHHNNWIKSLLDNNQKAIPFIICEYDTPQELNQAEVMWIANYKILGCDLTNATRGGDGVVMTQEIRDKISKAKKGKPSNFKGKKHSKEAKQKMSKLATIRWSSNG